MNERDASPRTRRAPSGNDAWTEVDDLRSATLPLAGQQSIGYSAWRRALRREPGYEFPIAPRVLITAGAVLLVLLIAGSVYALTQSSLREAGELLLLVLYFAAIVVAIPLIIMLAGFLLRLPARAIGALRRR